MRIPVRFALLAALTLTGCKGGGGSAASTPATPAPTSAPAASKSFEPLVAHSGGLAKGLDYTNSVQALDGAYAAGLRWFELDMALTKDDQIVLVNNWGDGFEKLFPGAARGRQSHAEFMALKMAEGLTQMDLAALQTWMRAHPDAIVVTDVKDDNAAVLAKLAERAAPLKERFVAQIYHFEEYAAVKSLGFPKIILSLYAMEATDDEVLAFVKDHPVHAVAMPPERAKAADLPKKLGDAGLPVYVHTINAKDELQALLALGVDGVYTDSLAATDLTAAK